MQYKWLGRTGLQVSQLCFGTMSFGAEADKAEAGKMFAACRDKGINFFDCADAYSGGQAEEILGKLMHSERNELIIASKCFNPTDQDINSRGANRRHIARAVEASLQRLGTDHLDILFMHQWDPHTPVEETLRALECLVSDGKVLYLGASNYSAWQIAKALGVCARHGWPRLDVIQPMYNLVKRQAEVELLPLAAEEELAVITYSPVGGGVLSGKYGPDRHPDQGRLIVNKQYAARYGEAWVYETAASFSAVAKQRAVHPVSLAVAWVAAHPQVTCPIIGARNLQQLQPSLLALDIEMTVPLREQLSALSRTPPPATDRLENQV